jgi:hypothetical protein
MEMPELETTQQNLSNQLQRTADWMQQRKGRFTGSKIKEIMKCDRSTACMEWGRPEKIVGLGEGAIKYIYTKAMERKRNKIIFTPTSAAMQYGTNNEEYVKHLVEQKYSIEIEEVGFIEFIENIAGASPDGYVTEYNCAVEIKCATEWNGVYNRMAVALDESHMDFWQLQSEMLALKTDKLLYAVAEPSENIFEPNITDVQAQWVPASEIHQNAIINRCKLGDAIINLYLKSDLSFHQAVQTASTKFEIT